MRSMARDAPEREMVPLSTMAITSAATTTELSRRSATSPRSRSPLVLLATSVPIDWADTQKAYARQEASSARTAVNESLTIMRSERARGQSRQSTVRGSPKTLREPQGNGSRNDDDIGLCCDLGRPL